MNRVIRLTLPVALVALVSLPAAAQRPGPGRLTAGILGGVTFPTGDFKDEVSTGWHAGGLVKMRAYGVLDIRLDGAYAKFGKKDIQGTAATVSTDANMSYGTLNALINLGPDSAAYPEDKTNSPYLLAGIGRYRLDFNRAHNMPCAYTDFATCPVPPAQNTLPFAVEAGEQTPRMDP